MEIADERREDWFLNKINIETIKEVDKKAIKKINNCKYINLDSNKFDIIFEKFQILKDGNVNLKDKTFTIQIVDGFYLTIDQCNKLLDLRTQIESCGAKLKVKDGNYWDLEEVLVVSSQLDDIVNKINSTTIEENGVKRPLNELEKFLWVYSFVANRKYRENFTDKDSSRYLTSIFNVGDCVCVGFSTILKELCDKLNIECYRNSCQVFDKNRKKEFGHANNIVVINGTAYYCDACWDCVSETRPRRTFANCLTSFEDRRDSIKTSISKPSAPFCDIKTDLADLKKKLKEIELKDFISEDDMKGYTSYENEINKYLQRFFSFEDSSTEIINIKNLFAPKNKKDELIDKYKRTIKEIEQKQIQNPLQIKTFEQSLVNIYTALGNSKTQAQEKAKLDIDASILEAGSSYYDTVSNCFANEYYKNLQV